MGVLVANELHAWNLKSYPTILIVDFRNNKLYLAILFNLKSYYPSIK